MELLLALIGWALIVTAGYFIGKNKGREVAGVILAALLGLIGLFKLMNQFEIRRKPTLSDK